MFGHSTLRERTYEELYSQFTGAASTSKGQVPKGPFPTRILVGKQAHKPGNLSVFLPRQLLTIRTNVL